MIRKIKRMIKRLRQSTCDHDWQTTKFQALVPGIGQQCTKCEKQRQIYPRGTG